MIASTSRDYREGSRERDNTVSGSDVRTMLPWETVIGRIAGDQRKVKVTPSNKYGLPSRCAE